MLDHKDLQAKYVAKDHRHAEEFIEWINMLSEKMDHFAEVTQDVAEVSVKTTTFDVKGLTLLDFQLAMMVDAYAEKNDIEQVRMSGNFGMHEDQQGVAEDSEPVDREWALVKKLGRLGERIVQNPRLWERYSEAIDSGNNDWIVSLIQEGTGADKNEIMALSELFGEIGGGLGRLVDFAWAVKEGTWKDDFLIPYRQHRAQGVAEGHKKK
jgi:pterin-4a-carbinolamine dehydratase